MLEYKILKTKVNEAEVELNRLAEQGWRVVSTDLIQGVSLTQCATPMVITLEREQPGL